jgi:hypothetical protein
MTRTPDRNVVTYNRLARWTLEGSAGPDSGPVEIANSAGLANAICRALARQNPLFEWDGGRLSSVHFRKPHKSKMRPTFIGVAGQTRAQIEAQREEAEWEQSRRGVSVSELLTTTARQIGISYATLYRLTHRSSATVDWTTIWNLLRYLRDEGDRKAILSCLLTPGARRVRQGYVAFVVRELRRLSRKRLGKHDVLMFDAERTLWVGFQLDARRLGADARRIELSQLRVYDALIGWSRLRAGLEPAERARLAKSAYRRELEILRLERRELSRDQSSG